MRKSAKLEQIYHEQMTVAAVKAEDIEEIRAKNRDLKFSPDHKIKKNLWKKYEISDILGAR